MRLRILSLAAVLIATNFFPARAKTPEYAPPSPSRQVASIELTWHDAARDRDVPVKIYYPAHGKGPFPVIIFSHGLGGSREGYGYLGEYWAGCGYVSVHLQHHGSDDAVWRDAGGLIAAAKAMQDSVKDVSNAINRAQDVSFAIDELAKMEKDSDSPLKGRLNLARIGMSGHSFGGWTTTAIAGETFGAGRPALGDPRVKAAVAMSAPVPPLADRKGAFDTIKIPIFYMTGTLDDSPIGETKASERRIPFDGTSHAETCLVIFKGADHMAFSGHVVPRDSDAGYQRLICIASEAFWDAYLKDDPGAKQWLYNGGFTKLLDGKGTFEVKMPAGK
ncbi:MAG TPA: hypothetical protein VG733_18275 [Chthoniobacteraceae bacterium]|nr:hypothetical protein [Chthoniobacteraceae bacterium]